MSIIYHWMLWVADTCFGDISNWVLSLRVYTLIPTGMLKNGIKGEVSETILFHLFSKVQFNASEVHLGDSALSNV